MSYDEYWNDDPRKVRFYRQADKLRQNRMNEEKWLQGMYVYDAIIRLAPIFKAFGKGQKPMEYPAEPYPIDEKSAKESEKKKEDKQMEKGKAFMESFMVAHNESLKEGK